MGEFTQALAALRTGQERSAAVNALFESTYADLKHLAHERLRRNQPVTSLNTTSLVHESYMRFIRAERLGFEDRAHFLAYAATVMRTVTIDLVRRKMAQRRGGGNIMLTLSTELRDQVANEDDLLRLDDALQTLGQADPQLVQIVEMRYFAGLPVDQVAESLQLSPRTVFRLWEKARLILFDALHEN